jgi:hypothetical protein
VTHRGPGLNDRLLNGWLTFVAVAAGLVIGLGIAVMALGVVWLGEQVLS